MKNIILLLIITLFFACKPHADKQTEASNVKADSLNIKLNSPELKAVNEELLKTPNEPTLYNKRANIYITLKQPQEAINDAKRAIRLDSSNADYYITIVDALFTQNKTRDAKEVLERIEKKFPENTETLLKLSELYFLVRQYQKAIDYVNKALKIDENLAKAYYLKGSIYRESGDTTRAISSIETAVEQDNKYEDAYYDLGVMYGARKNPLALDYYNNTLRINPSNQNALYARAKLLQDLGKIEEAILEYKNIVLKNKNCENCYYNLGAIYLEIKKDNILALENFTKAIAINPNYVEAYLARAYTYSKLKDKENAKADYQMCLKLEPNYQAAIMGLNAL